MTQGERPCLRDNQGEAVREYALTAPYTDGPAQAEIAIPKGSSDYLERTRAREGAEPRLTLKVDPDTESPRVGPQPFSININIPWSQHARDSGTPEALAGMLRWKLVSVVPPDDAQGGAGRGRYPQVMLGEPQASGDGRIELKATVRWPQGTGETHWRGYRLEGRLNLERPVPPWIEEWAVNTDTLAESGNRTFNLVSSLSNLWRNPALEKQLVAEIYLRVGPM